MKSLLCTSLLVLSLAFNYSFSQTTHDVALESMTFNPDDLTITVNDIVRWTNNGGLHNVVADDNSFTSGNTSTSLWVFEHTFDAEGVFRYYCSEHGAANGIGMAGIIRVEGTTDVNDDFAKMDYRLKQNYPNPFNPTTTIEYFIPQNSFVTLKIYNVTGSLEKVLISEYQPGGNYIVELNASDLTSGVYFYQLKADDYITTKKMTVLK